jgi:hypothetical protein
MIHERSSRSTARSPRDARLEGRIPGFEQGYEDPAGKADWLANDDVERA